MGLRIATNVQSMNAQKNLFGTSNEIGNAMARLSSGLRINKASDDAAGLAISEGLKAQMRGFKQAVRNANDGVSLVQVAEGALGEVSNMLIRLRELSIQAASDTVGDRERGMIDIEYQHLKEEIERVSQTTQFNGTPLLNGLGGVLDFQVGNYNDPMNDRISFNAQDKNVGVQNLNIAEIGTITKRQAQESLTNIDEAMIQVSSMRADLGALQGRLNSTSSVLMTADENFAAANSRIRDADIAAESSNLAKNNILQQAATAVLQQANQSQQLALKLLG
jgi:flagellin